MTVPPVASPGVGAGRLIATLGGAGALAGLLLVFVHQATAPTIQAYKAERLHSAVREVLREPQRTETLYLVDGALVTRRPEGTPADQLERVWVGYGERDDPMGFAIVAAEPGFQDVIRVIFGWNASAHQLLAMRVLESRETPGLGDKIEKDAAFVDQFEGATPPLLAVKPAGGIREPGHIDIISGATISSRAVIRIIDRALERWTPLLEAWEEQP